MNTDKIAEILGASEVVTLESHSDLFLQLLTLYMARSRDREIYAEKEKAEDRIQSSIYWIHFLLVGLKTGDGSALLSNKQKIRRGDADILMESILGPFKEHGDLVSESERKYLLTASRDLIVHQEVVTSLFGVNIGEELQSIFGEAQP